MESIISYDSFEIRLSSSFDELWRIRYDPETQVKTKTYIYRRVRTDDPIYKKLSSLSVKHNVPKTFTLHDKKYDLYILEEDNARCGYMLSPRKIHGEKGVNIVDRIYFTYVKTIKKER